MDLFLKMFWLLFLDDIDRTSKHHPPHGQTPPLIEDVTDVNVPRVYSGPVKIDKLRIRLLDDKGNLVNLHDNDWSFTLIVEQLH